MTKFVYWEGLSFFACERMKDPSGAALRTIEARECVVASSRIDVRKASVVCIA